MPDQPDSESNRATEADFHNSVDDSLREAQKWLEKHRKQAIQGQLIGSTHRVNQLDAVELDEELLRMLREQVNKCFSYFHQSALDSFEPELQALLRLSFFAFSIVADTPSPGNALQNLCYQPTSLQRRLLYTFLGVAMPYLHSRLDRTMLLNEWSSHDNNWRSRLYSCVRGFDAFYRGMSLLNFFMFVYNGRYRSLIDRILRMRLVYIRPDASRHVAFDFMNQQLIWSGFSEFILFLLPLLNLPKLRRTLRRLVLHLPYFRKDNREAGCPICGIEPIPTPFVASCSHVFCYYCLRASRIAEPKFQCPVCDVVVTSQTRLQPSTTQYMRS